MRLSEIHIGNRHIQEGIHIGDYQGLTPEAILNAKGSGGKRRRGGGAGGGGLTDLYMSREYLHRPEDHPEDIVHTQLINKVEQLPAVPDDPHAIRSFRGAKILYAFTLVPSKGFTDPAVKSGWQLPHGLESQIREFKTLYQEYYKFKGIPVKDRKVFNTDAELHTRLERVESELRKVEYDLKQYATQRLEKLKTDLSRERDLINSFLELMNTHKMKSLDELGEEAGSYYDVDDKRITRNEFAASHLKYAAQSLARKIKNPTTDGEKQMSLEITNSAAANLARLTHPFDVIVLPASSSSYNLDVLVGAVKQQPGWENIPVVPLTKMTGRQASDEIDVASLIERAEEAHQRSITSRAPNSKLTLNPDQIARVRASIGDMPMPRIDETQPLSPSQPEWVEWWVAGRVAAIRAALSRHLDVPVPIKELTDIDSYKKYMQIYTADPASLQGLKGKRVLVLDDNVNHQATMQMVHSLVKKASPAEVLIYTPFFMGG